LLVCAAANTRGQGPARLDIMSGAGVGPAGSWTRESKLDVALGASRARAFAFFNADGQERDGRVSLNQMRLEGAWQSRPVGPFRISAAAASAAAPGASGPVTLDSRVNVSARLGSGGMWLGAGSSIDGDVTGGAGAWQAIGGAIITLSYEPQQLLSRRHSVNSRRVSGPDSIYFDTAGRHVIPTFRMFVDTINESSLRSHPGLELRGDWAAGRWMVSAAGNRAIGLTGAIGSDSAPVSKAVSTATVTLAARVSGAFGLVASFGASSQPTVRTPARYAAVGVRVWSPSLRRPVAAPVRPAATAFAVTLVDPGTYRMVLRVPGARTAEVSGDFNDWKPVALREVSPNVWEATVPMTPGTHRINVRINGDAWTAPPNVPTVNDEFNGRVGIIVVR
jgi:hypothetical protein